MYEGLQLGLGLANAINQIGDTNRKRAYEDEVSRHLQGFQQNGEKYTPGDDFDAKAFTDAQVDYVNSLLKSEELQQQVFQRQKTAIDASYRSVIDSSKKADGLRALGMNDKAFDMMMQAYESFPDGGDANWSRNDDHSISFTINNPLTNEKTTKSFANDDEFWSALEGYVKKVSDPTAFAQTALGERNKLINYNAKRIFDAEVLTNDNGEKVRHFTELIDPDTGKPMNGNLPDGTPVENGQAFVDLKSGKVLTAKEAAERGFVSLDDQKKLVDIEEKKASAKKEKALGLKALAESADKPESPEGKLAYDLSHGEKPIFASRDEAMRFVMKLKNAESMKEVTAMLVKEGLEPEDSEYKAVMQMIKDSTPGLPDEERGIPGTPRKANEIPPHAKELNGVYYWIGADGKKYSAKKEK